jgi:hypothetical protein
VGRIMTPEQAPRPGPRTRTSKVIPYERHQHCQANEAETTDGIPAKSSS